MGSFGRLNVRNQNSYNLPTAPLQTKLSGVHYFQRNHNAVILQFHQRQYCTHSKTGNVLARHNLDKLHCIHSIVASSCVFLSCAKLNMDLKSKIVCHSYILVSDQVVEDLTGMTVLQQLLLDEVGSNHSMS